MKMGEDMLNKERNNSIYQRLNYEETPYLFGPSTTHGGILQQRDGTHVYLRNYHVFGRSSNCHTILTSADVSRIHMIVFWSNENKSWYIQDRSINGIWVNDHKLVKYRSLRMTKDDIITICSKKEHSFKLVNTQPPCDIIISLKSRGLPIYLKKPITVTSDLTYFLYLKDRWTYVIDPIDVHSPCYRTIKDLEIIRIGDSDYQVQLNNNNFNTISNRPSTYNIADLIFIFTVTKDEENISLKITVNNESSTVEGVRQQSQLYLLLYMARKSLGDQQQGYASCKRGWINLNVLSEKLRITPENMRIRVHRLRNRIRELVNFNDIDVCELIQIQDGDVRLNSSRIKIINKN